MFTETHRVIKYFASSYNLKLSSIEPFDIGEIYSEVIFYPRTSTTLNLILTARQRVLVIWCNHWFEAEYKDLKVFSYHSKKEGEKYSGFKLDSYLYYMYTDYHNHTEIADFCSIDCPLIDLIELEEFPEMYFDEE